MIDKWCSTINRSTHGIRAYVRAAVPTESDSKHSNDKHTMKRILDLNETVADSTNMLSNDLPMRHMSSPGQDELNASMKRETVDASSCCCLCSAISESTPRQARSISSTSEQAAEPSSLECDNDSRSERWSERQSSRSKGHWPQHQGFEEKEEGKEEEEKQEKEEGESDIEGKIDEASTDYLGASSHCHARDRRGYRTLRKDEKSEERKQQISEAVIAFQKDCELSEVFARSHELIGESLSHCFFFFLFSIFFPFLPLSFS
eukprot:s6644_g3.t1